MSDEFAIREVARDLKRLYEGLDEAKHSRPKPREVRTMKPSPGPSEPGNWLWISRCVTMEQRLREVALDAFGDIQVRLRDGDMVVHNLLDKIAFNAQAIAELDWADDFLEELDSQARQIGKWLNPPEPDQAAKRLEPFHESRVIIQRAARHGHTLTRDGLRKLAERSQNTEHPISTEQYAGRTTYRFTEVMAYINRGSQAPDQH